MKTCPEAIIPHFRMSTSNESILLHQGAFSFSFEGGQLELKGEVKLQWSPSVSIVFHGTLVSQDTEMNEQSLFWELFKISDGDVHVDGLRIGRGILLSARQYPFSIYGIMNGDVSIGDVGVPVEEIHFSVVNLREFHGLCIKRGESYTGMDRLAFDDDTYSFILDKVEDFKKYYSAIQKEGGFAITYNGLIKRQNGNPIRLSEVRKALERLKWFLSFLNGSHVGILLPSAKFRENLLWVNCGYVNVSPYNNPPRWAPQDSMSSFFLLFQSYTKLWKGASYEIKSLIDWYSIVNSNNGYRDDKLVMGQAALELLYNWYIVEQKGLLKGDDARNIDASNKIRLLLNEIRLNTTCPPTLNRVQEMIDDKDLKLKDAIDVIVEIRNAIIHSNLHKRTKISKIIGEAKYQVLNLTAYYLELAILFTFGYSGTYVNRLSSKNLEVEAIENVPWIAI